MKKLLITVILLIYCAYANAQIEHFPVLECTPEAIFNRAYLDYIPSEEFIPTTLTECFESFPRFLGLGYYYRGCYDQVMESKDKNFILLVPPITPTGNNVNIRRSLSEREEYLFPDFKSKDISTVVYLSPIRMDMALILDKSWREITLREIKEYIHYLSSGYARDKFNADTVITYPIPLKKGESLRGRYNHCEILLLYKIDKAYVLFYFFYTDKGYRKRKKYIQEVEKMLRFKEEL